MKLTKLICIVILEFIATTTLASSYNQFYVALDGGIFQADFDNQYLDQTDTIAQNIVQPSVQHGYTGGITLGYSRLLCQDFLMGAAISAHMDSNNASFQSGASNTTLSDQIQINNHFDLTFVPGLMLTNDIASYLKLGISYARLSDDLSSPAGFDSTITNYHSHPNKKGFAAGLGIVKLLTEHVSLFTEADYHDYGTIGFSNFQNFMSTYNHSMHVYSYSVVIGAAYTI